MSCAIGRRMGMSKPSDETRRPALVAWKSWPWLSTTWRRHATTESAGVASNTRRHASTKVGAMTSSAATHLKRGVRARSTSELKLPARPRSRGWRTYVMRSSAAAAAWAIRGVSSSEALSVMTMRRSVTVCARTEARLSSRYRAPLRTGIPMVTRGPLASMGITAAAVTGGG